MESLVNKVAGLNAWKVQHEQSTTRGKKRKGARWKDKQENGTTGKEFNMKKKCNMEIAQHEKCTTRRKCNMKRMHKRNNIKRMEHRKGATRNEYNTKKVLLKNSAKWEMWYTEKSNTKSVQH